MRKVKNNGVHKGTLQEIFKLVLTKGFTTTSEVMNALPGVHQRNIWHELSKHHRDGIILSVSGTSGGRGNSSIITLGFGFKDALNYSDLSREEIELLSVFLSKSDTEIRRSLSNFKKTLVHSDSSNNNAYLEVVQAEFKKTLVHSDSSNNNA